MIPTIKVSSHGTAIKVVQAHVAVIVPFLGTPPATVNTGIHLDTIVRCAVVCKIHSHISVRIGNEILIPDVPVDVVGLIICADIYIVSRNL